MRNTLQKIKKNLTTRLFRRAICMILKAVFILMKMTVTDSFGTSPALSIIPYLMPWKQAGLK